MRPFARPAAKDGVTGTTHRHVPEPPSTGTVIDAGDLSARENPAKSAAWIEEIRSEAAPYPFLRSEACQASDGIGQRRIGCMEGRCGPERTHGQSRPHDAAPRRIAYRQRHGRRTGSGIAICLTARTAPAAPDHPQGISVVTGAPRLPSGLRGKNDKVMVTGARLTVSAVASSPAVTMPVMPTSLIRIS